MPPNRLESATIQINSILGGQSDTYHLAGEDQFLMSIGIDPEFPFSTTTKASGAIFPVPMSRFSGEGVRAAPMWITGAETTSGVFVYDDGGSMITYSATLLTETAEWNLANASGNGMVSYNDYIYLSTDTTIARFGRLSLTAPTMNTDYWVTGLSMSALTNTTYPSTRNVEYPNHVLHRHSDGRVYVADYDGANGRIHSFTTDSVGTNGSARFDDLTLPPGHLPTAMASYGDDLAVLMTSQGQYASGSIPVPGHAALVLWDTVIENKFYRYIPIPDPLATAMINKSGELYVWSGNIDTDVKLLRYLGGHAFEKLTCLGEGSPPPAGAVDANGNQVVWGGWGTYPTTHASVYAYGYRCGRLPGAAMNNIVRITNTSDTLPIVSCVRYVRASPYPVVGWRTDTTANFGIDRRAGTTLQANRFRSRVINVGKRFVIRRIVIPLTRAVEAGVSISITIHVDSETSSTSLTTITNTDFSGEQRIDYQSLSVEGETNFFLDAEFNSSVDTGIAPGISFELEMYS